MGRFGQQTQTDIGYRIYDFLEVYDFLFFYMIFGGFRPRNQSHWVRFEILRRTPAFLRPELAYEVDFDKKTHSGPIIEIRLQQNAKVPLKC